MSTSTPASVPTHTVHRQDFTALRRGGLNWDSFPLKLFAKGNKKFWDPDDLDFSQDAADWQALSETEREYALLLCAQFIAGEEAVTQDIRPFLDAMAAEGRFADEMYLTQFNFEEAKHVQVFRRWLDAVGVREDLHRFVADNPGYRTLFYEALPESLHVLHDDPSPANQVRASVTYNHVIEGALALTGYFSWNKVCTSRGILPGMQRLVKLIGDDERRHMAWGTFTCRRHVAADDDLWPGVSDRINELLPHAVTQIEHALGSGELPFDLSTDELVRYATDRAMRRLGTIESARGADLAAIDVDSAPEQLEERFGEEDAQELAAAG